MYRRGCSSTISENELDISNALFAEDFEPNDADVSRSAAQSATKHRENERTLMGDDLELDDEAIITEQQSASNRKASNLKGRTVKRGGGFQALGLDATLLKAITRKGFSVPTPIQRKTIPLLLEDKDVVGMARTGSGKTAAFIVPMIQKLKAHSTTVGARALILSPSRELALQTLQVIKDLGRGTDLKSSLLVGGDSFEEQFASMAGNPDVIIATPGRFLHLKVEMGLDLSTVRYAVFDEADRLFEMGFATHLTEILHSLPASRQTLLFSATLPKSLVEFARAGLQDPVLVRLDSDNKISPDLKSVFLTVKSSEKEGALLHLLQDVIQMPTGACKPVQTFVAETEDKDSSRKRKRSGTVAQFTASQVSNPYSTIIFASTKHHVEYLAHLLRIAGYAVSHAYGSLDQTARKAQAQAFRSASSNILVVTDVAARGIDIPTLANVINYDFPPQPKIFLHRVGRTARAGQKGWSYSIIHDADAPYLLDLQLFLGRKLVVGRGSDGKMDFTRNVVVGSLHRDNMQSSCEWVSRQLAVDADIAALRAVALKGEKLYLRTRNVASSESAKRARNLVASDAWTELHPLFNNEYSDTEIERESMLARVGGFRPRESVFEIGPRRGGRKNAEEAVDAMRKIRSALKKKKQRAKPQEMNDDSVYRDADQRAGTGDDHDNQVLEAKSSDVPDVSDSELEVTISQPKPKESTRSVKAVVPIQNEFRDSENFMSYTPKSTNLADDRAYGVHSGSHSNFTESARGATMDLALDESAKGFGEARGIMRWDKRQKKYVAKQNDYDGSKGKRLVRGESGVKIAASFRSGRYDAWRKANRVGRAPRVGEAERRASSSAVVKEKRYRHKSLKAPKHADRFREDFEKRKKKVEAAQERSKSQVGRKEVRSVDEIRRERKLQEKRREKNARPSKKSQR